MYSKTNFSKHKHYIFNDRVNNKYDCLNLNIMQTCKYKYNNIIHRHNYINNLLILLLNKHNYITILKPQYPNP